MNDILIFFELRGQTVATQQSIIYSLIGLGAFLTGYFFLPRGLACVKTTVLTKKWKLSRAVPSFLVLFLAGFALKAVKVAMGADVTGVMPVTIFRSPLIAFFLSLNWFHYLGQAIINVAYQEARSTAQPQVRRLRLHAYFVNVFVLLASLTSGSDTATLFPLLSMIIIKQFYRPLAFGRMLWFVSALVAAVEVFKNLVTEVFFSGTPWADAPGSVFSLFYILFYRINMSYVMTAVIDYGRAFYPKGTLGQFWVDFGLYGTERINVHDGNIFGRVFGLISKEDYVTGVAITNMGDYYVNFGLIGIVIGMVLNGIIFKIIYETCRQRQPTLVLFYALVWPILIHGLESPVTVLYSTVIKMAFFCLMVHLFLLNHDTASIKEMTPRIALVGSAHVGYKVVGRAG